jgi:hypothetical protein
MIVDFGPYAGQGHDREEFKDAPCHKIASTRCHRVRDDVIEIPLAGRERAEVVTGIPSR